MNSTFEKQCCDRMLTAVFRKRLRKRIIGGAAVVLLFIGVIPWLPPFFEPSVSISELTDVPAQPPGGVMKPHMEIVTEPGHYQLIDVGFPRHVVIRSNLTPNYALLSQSELLAALPDKVAIRFEADGSGTLMNFP